MTEIYTNTSHYVYFDIYNSTASGTPTATLVRTGAVNAPLTVSSATTNPGATQSWKAYIPLAETTADGEFVVQWAATVGGEQATKADYVEVVTPYISPEEIASKYGWSFNSGDANYKPRQDVVDAERIARYTINAYTRSYFSPKIKSVDAYGQNTDVLYVDENVRSISKLYQNGELVIDGIDISKFGWAVEPTETGKGIRIVDPDFSDLYETETIRVPGTGRAAFKQGFRYTVVGGFGYAYVPSIIAEATAMLVNDYMCRDAIWRARYINKVEMRDWKFTFEKEAFRGTGNLIVDNLLKDFRDLGIFVI